MPHSVDNYCVQPIEAVPRAMTLRAEVAELEATARALPSKYSPGLRTGGLTAYTVSSRNKIGCSLMTGAEMGKTHTAPHTACLVVCRGPGMAVTELS